MADEPSRRGETGSDETIPEESLTHRYEVRQVNIKMILLFSGTLVLILGLILIVLWVMLQGWTERSLTFIVPQMVPATVEQPTPAGPNLQPAPAQDFQAWYAEEVELMRSYGWVQPDEDIAHIPIQRAMELLVEQGLPARDGEVPSFELDPAYGLDSSGGQFLRSEEE